MGKDYYAVLELETNATKEDIRKAYRKKALEYHPDKNKDPDAEENFKEIAEAYEVLIDDDKKTAYDLYGDAGLKSSKSHPSRKGPRHTFTRNFSFHPSDPFDLFTTFFDDRDPFKETFADHFASLFDHHQQVHQNLHHLHGAAMFKNDPFFTLDFHAKIFDDLVFCRSVRRQTRVRTPSASRVEDDMRKEQVRQGGRSKFGRQQSAPTGHLTATSPTWRPRSTETKTLIQNTLPKQSYPDHQEDASSQNRYSSPGKTN